MKILPKYLMRNIIGSTLIVLLMLLSLLVFVEFTKQLGSLGTKEYGLWEATLYVLLRVPQDAYQLFPMAGLIGTLIGLGRLASGSELIVMQTSGVSMFQFLSTVIKAALIMLVVATFVGELLAPRMSKYADAMRTEAVSGGQVSQSKQGIWLRQGNDFIHIQKISDNGQLVNAIRYQFDNSRKLTSVSLAPTGTFEDGRWVLQNVIQSVLTPKQIEKKHYPEQNWNLVLDPKVYTFGKVKLKYLTISHLAGLIAMNDKSGLESHDYQYAYWKRIAQPLTTIVMICLAVPFVFGSLRSVSMGLRITIGVIVGFTFFTLTEAFGPLGKVLQISPPLVALLPTVCVMVFGLMLAKRMKY